MSFLAVTALFALTVQADTIRSDAEALKPFVRSELANAFLSQAKDLPHIDERTLYRDAKGRWWTKEESERLSEADKKDLKDYQLPESVYYNTKYGSPLAYSRPLDLLGQQGFKIGKGTKIMDFGYGTIGHLRLLAGMGAEVVGVDVDSLLRALYSFPGDQGPIGNSGGSIRLVDGFFPSDPVIKAQVGSGYDLIMSKNTLKRGYIHPEREADKRMLIDLGVDDATYLKTVYDYLKPGGYFMIYNLSPAQNPPDKPFLPMADGRCPFSNEDVEKAGFKVVEYDRIDDEAAREMAHALRWDAGEHGMDLKKDLFAHFSLFQKPA